jgi:hypothetical protein
MKNYIELPIGNNKTLFVFKHHIVGVETNSNGGCTVYINHTAYSKGIELEDFTVQEILDFMA